jgi:phospholipid/cholesterol/gamma-HCH transport system permease protein
MSDKGSLIKKQGEMSIRCVRFQREGDDCLCSIQGNWSLESGEVRFAHAEWKRFIFANPTASSFRFSSVELGEWDSALIVFLNQCRHDLVELKKDFDTSSLPKGIVRLLNLSLGKRAGKQRSEFNLNRSIDYLEGEIVRLGDRIKGVAAFLGEWILGFVSVLGGRSRMRVRDLFGVCRSCGASALPIVTLVSFLTGLTMAFVGSVQLEKFNAKIYVADLVCLAMVREMGALMVAIVMAGRTGAAFAAELGSMKLNEEIDSLQTFGISAMQFLVLPRTIGLLLMIPLLTLYADVVGILGGLTVGTQVMDFSVLHYFEQTQTALGGMWEVYSGLVKSLVFGLIIGLVGCYKGLTSGKDSASLGRSVTSAVVTSVTLIVVADALFEIVFSYLDLR